MKRVLTLFLLLYGTAGVCQESTIRILGAYPSHLGLSSSAMSGHLQAIATTWNNSGLPGASVTTVQLLNSAVAVPVSYPGLPSTAIGTADVAWQQSSITTLRHAWKADVIILFTNHQERCGAATIQWANGNFVPNPQTQNLDLRYRHQWYIAVVNPNCPSWVAPHEFGHLLGGGHYSTGARLYSDARAWLTWIVVSGPAYSYGYYQGTALADSSDATQRVSQQLQYSRNSSGYGDAGHQNVRTFSVTARSVANFYEYPSASPILNPPINLHGVNRGCWDGTLTRYDLYWSDDPATNVPTDRYEIWKSQPVGQPFVYGWTEYGPFSPSYVAGATARARVNACSGSTCSALSQTYFDAVPLCPGH